MRIITHIGVPPLDRDELHDRLPGLRMRDDRPGLLVPLPPRHDGVGRVVRAPLAQDAATLETRAAADVQGLIVGGYLGENTA